MAKQSLLALYLRWTELADIPVSDESALDQKFQHFDIGTPIEDVWRWFESQNPKFSVAALQQGMATLDDKLPAPQVLTVLEVDMTAILPSYDTPDERHEWKWVEEHCSFRHKGNGEEGGVWEFMVHITNFDKDGSLPDELFPLYVQAVNAGVAWVMFHQG